MNVPADLRYTKEHEWIRGEGNVATVGITDYAQGELGDIVFVELPGVGDEIAQHETFGTIEAVKAVSDLYAPVSGRVTEIHTALEDDPMVINRDPHGDGWMVKVDIADVGQLDDLLDAAGYQSLLDE